MRLTFLGTKGYIDERSDRHARHTSALIEQDGARVRIDCGLDWAGRAGEHDPSAIVVTHAHPDHVGGLEKGAPCPVWATDEAWEAMAEFEIEDRRAVEPRKPFEIGPIRFEAFPVEHSIKCPAVGYRIEAGGGALFYLPDVVYLPDQNEALAGVGLYVGDGSTIDTSLVRRAGDALVGHTTIRAQIGWCAEHGVERALFTHCGSQIVGGDERSLGPKVARLGEQRGVEAAFAHDGMVVELP